MKYISDSEDRVYIAYRLRTLGMIFSLIKLLIAYYNGVENWKFTLKYIYMYIKSRKRYRKSTQVVE